MYPGTHCLFLLQYKTVMSVCYVTGRGSAWWDVGEGGEVFLWGGPGKTPWRRELTRVGSVGGSGALDQTYLFQSSSHGGKSPWGSCFSHLYRGDDDTAGLEGITGKKAQP